MWLRWAVSAWLKNEAQRRAQEAVSEAVMGRATAPDEADAVDDDPDVPCDVGVIFALGIESGGLVELLEKRVDTRGAGFRAHTGWLEGRRLVVMESGAGPQPAAKATSAMIAGHQPRWIISAGLAGGLVPQLAKNDLVVANSVANPTGERLVIDLKLQPEAHLHVGRLLTVDHIVRTPTERHALHAAHDALAVDMESFAVADVCRREKTRFLAIRAVSDTADQELPADIERLLKQTTLSGQAGAVVGSIFRRPSSIKDMWKLHEDALLASHRLAGFLREVILQLAPPQQG